MVSPLFWREAIFIVLLLAMAVVDRIKRVIPDGLLLAAVFNRAAWAIVQNEISSGTLCTMLISAMVVLCLLILILVLDGVKGGSVMGGGDVKLLFVMALYLDWHRLLQVLLAACVSGLLAAFVFHKKSGDTIPFGPFLAAGYILLKSGFLSFLFLL